MTSSKDELNGYIKDMKAKERNSSYSLTERERFGSLAKEAMAGGRKSKRPSLTNSSVSGKAPAKSNYMADWKAKRTALDSEGDKLSSTKGDMTDWRKRSTALDSEGDKLSANKPFRGVKPGPNRNARIAALKGKLK